MLEERMSLLKAFARRRVIVFAEDYKSGLKWKLASDKAVITQSLSFWRQNPGVEQYENILP